MFHVKHIISIPYGAIKRSTYSKIRKEYKEFQFLMVRLKGVSILAAAIRDAQFQFLMVRLKVNSLS